MIIRSHEVKKDGYEVEHNGRCITVFSAPNYWYVRVCVINIGSCPQLSSIHVYNGASVLHKKWATFLFYKGHFISPKCANVYFV